MLVYTYMPKEMYETLMIDGKIYPLEGYSGWCGYTESLYKEFKAKYNKPIPFFGWALPTEENWKDDEDKSFAYCEMEVPDNIITKTSFDDWNELLIVQYSLEQLLKENPNATWNDISTNSKEDLWHDFITANDGTCPKGYLQLLIDYFDKSFIKRVCFKSEENVSMPPAEL